MGNCTGVSNCVTLDSGTLYQTMDGWRATAGVGEADCAVRPYWSGCPGHFTGWTDAALNTAVEMGLNSIRLEIQPSIENTRDWAEDFYNGVITYEQWRSNWYRSVNDNGNATSINPSGFKWYKLDHSINHVVIPLRQKLAARGETLRVEMTYVDFGPSSFDQLSSPNEYAEFVLATYLHMQNTFGFVPDVWDVINEPDLSTPQYSGAQIGQAIKAAGDRLAANGFTPHFNGPSTTSAGQARYHIDGMAAVPGALQYIDTFTYHRYTGADPPMLQELWNRASQHGKKLAMTEWYMPQNSYVTLHEDLKFGHNSTWEEYALAFPGTDSGGILISVTGPSTVVISQRAKFYRQYFKHVRRNAVRYKATSNSGNLDALAWYNTDSTHVVVVKANTGGSVNITGLPSGSYGIFYTTGSEYNRHRTNQTIAFGQILSTSIPSAGVITIYAITGGGTARSGDGGDNLLSPKIAFERSENGGALSSLEGQKYAR